MIFLVVAGALIVGASIVAVILVSIASLREDAARSLGGSPPGAVAAAARRLLSVRTDGPVASPNSVRNGVAHLPDPRHADSEQAGQPREPAVRR
jgi:fructose-1,6-bisphosphatase/sedoheptulose 1,7-bisphosphatase-like protein